MKPVRIAGRVFLCIGKMPKPALFWSSIALLTGLGYFVFPGHSYLEVDTQMYVPMMERIYNPVLFSDDILIRNQNALALTAYDEIALGLRSYAGLDFEHGLKLEQVVFRGCAAAGLLLIAAQLGLGPFEAFFVAALVILNAGGTVIGITEPEPVPRAFALGLLLLGVGLALNGRFWGAGTAAALGFLIHPPTMAPFWAVAAFVVLRKQARPTLLIPLLPAVGILLLLVHFQPGTPEPFELLRRLEPFQEAFQRRYVRLVFVSEWNAKELLDCVTQSAVMGIGFWRLLRLASWRKPAESSLTVPGALSPSIRAWLGGFAVVAVVSVPVSWILLDQLRFAMVGPWAPSRAVVFIAVLSSLLSGTCGILAVRRAQRQDSAPQSAGTLLGPGGVGPRPEGKVPDIPHPDIPQRANSAGESIGTPLGLGRAGLRFAGKVLQRRLWWEAFAWFAIALALPVRGLLGSWFVDTRLILLVAGLAVVGFAGAILAGRSRGLSLAAAGTLPFFAFAIPALVPPAKPIDTPELKELASWAGTKTDETAMFLFADDGYYGATGPFRARALRSVYVDYEGRALAFLPQAAAEWSTRWRDANQGHWLIGPQDFQQLAEWHVDFVVLLKEHAIPAKRPEYSNAQYVVYRVLN